MKVTSTKKQTIETIAKVLISKKIPFVYEGSYLQVTDPIVKYELFQQASYHIDTKKLVLMCSDYTKSISFDSFLNYFAIK